MSYSVTRRHTRHYVIAFKGGSDAFTGFLQFFYFLFFKTCAEAQETQRNAIKKKNTAHSTEQCSCCGATASLQNAAVAVMCNMFNVN